MNVSLHQDAAIRSPFVRRMTAVAAREGLFGPGNAILVAVSGGPDSVALLSAMAALAPAWHLHVRAVHFNYGLRGHESQDDARFVQELCARMRIELICEAIDLARCRGGLGGGKIHSLQEAARAARYGAMLRIGAALGIEKIAVGHTADDQAETVLMWMIRGSGPAGLAGIPSARDAGIIRPLLSITRAEVLAYLRAEGLAFRTDSTNAKPLYVRNRIRRDLMPVLKRFNPSIVRVLTRQADILREENAWLERMAEERLAQLARSLPDGGLAIDRQGLVALPLVLQRRIIRAGFRRTAGSDRGPGFASVSAVLEQIANRRTGASLVVRNVCVSREYEVLRLSPIRSAAREPVMHQERAMSEASLDMPLPVPATRHWPATGQWIQTSLVHSVSSGASQTRSEAANTALVDADRLTPPLTVRRWRAGDVFQPLGMGGRQKKLQDFFSDIKLPRGQRNRIPLIVAPEGIVWIGGHRMDNRFRLTSVTQRIVRITLTDAAPFGGTE